jgi:hypothetical protein
VAIFYHSCIGSPGVFRFNPAGATTAALTFFNRNNHYGTRIRMQTTGKGGTLG